MGRLPPQNELLIVKESESEFNFDPTSFCYACDTSRVTKRGTTHNNSFIHNISSVLGSRISIHLSRVVYFFLLPQKNLQTMITSTQLNDTTRFQFWECVEIFERTKLQFFNEQRDEKHVWSFFSPLLARSFFFIIVVISRCIFQYFFSVESRGNA